MLFLNRQEKKYQHEAFEWIRTVATPNDVIRAEKNQSSSFLKFEFPIYPNDTPKRLRSDEVATFLIRFGENYDSPGPEWIRLFCLESFQLFESSKRHGGNLPLRFGLSDAEKKELSAFARSVLRSFLETGNFSDSKYEGSQKRLHSRGSVCVALWVDGALRGSMVSKNRPLSSGVVEAMLRAARDSRFKPIAAEELGRLKIELTFIKSPSFSLPQEALALNRLYPEKGYYAEAGEFSGWLLPEVLNGARHSGFASFLKMLLEEKLNAPRTLPASVNLFEVEDWVESSGATGIVPLYASMPAPSVPTSVPRSAYLAAGNQAADWIVRMQRPDGSLPSIIDPRRGLLEKEDEERALFSLLALAAFGAASKAGRYTAVAARGLTKYGAEALAKSPLFLAYAGQLALALDRKEEADAFAQRLLSMGEGQLAGDPITASQTAVFLRVYGAPLPWLEQFLEKSFYAAREKGKTELALYAEAANVFSGRPVRKEIISWLKEGQRPDGSFKAAVGRESPYTRGTGKIFEVLACDKKGNAPEVERAASWLFAMQYNEENTFFVAPEFRPMLIGGFRHDYVNPEAWVDAAGHVLLGCARLI